jgi:amino acid transporter
LSTITDTDDRSILFFSSWNVFLKGKWSAADFITNYLPLMLFPVLWIGTKLIKRTKFVRAEDMDFYEGLEQVEAESWDEPPPTSIGGKIWAAIM